ncbi:unnamed protein product [Anisakis simplex]|uniref:ZP domain-containing protein n=1 Tax=Anisakis simplex TaxID=6269 RepID=A0A0M3JIZ6_ANISI|nr:unnamed protein product [Anisakis simplex]
MFAEPHRSVVTVMFNCERKSLNVMPKGFVIHRRIHVDERGLNHDALIGVELYGLSTHCPPVVDKQSDLQ